MAGLKIYGAVLAACIALVATAAVLPTTDWIYRSAYWIGRDGPIDYGSGPDADLLEANDQRPMASLTAPEESLANMKKTAELGLKGGTVGRLSIGIRRIAQGTTFSPEKPDISERKKELGRIQIELGQAGAKLEPDNSFWIIMQAGGEWLNGDKERSAELFRRASECPVYNDHVLYEAQMRAELFRQVRGRLASNHEVLAYASILFPHFAGFKSLSRAHIGERPLAESAQQRAEVAQFGLKLSRNSDSIIGLLVGLSLIGTAVGDDEAPRRAMQTGERRSQTFTDEKIRREAGRHAADLIEAKRVFDLVDRPGGDMAANAQWSLVEEVRPQAATALLSIVILLAPLAFLLGRRAAVIREKEENWDRAAPFLLSLVGSLAAAAGQAGVPGQNMMQNLLPITLVALPAAGFSFLISKSSWRWILAAAHLILVWILFFLVQSPTQWSALAHFIAGLLPFLGLASLNRPGMEKLTAWTAWILWTIALVGACTFMPRGPSPFEVLDASTYVNEPVTKRLLEIVLCGAVGAVGAAAVTPAGAKGHWTRAAVMQCLMAAVLVGCIVQAVRLDKTVAQLIPNEHAQLDELQAEISKIVLTEQE